MRQYFENLEDSLLNSFAIKSKLSKGRSFQERPSKTRTCFQRDRDRIIHSKAFRRLKFKTQVFISTESDHYRTRLTHTIEVAQMSRHLARLLRVNEDLSECIALAHDLGHTPFGHSGEEKLNELLSHKNGFEHNLHSLKIINQLEKKYPKFSGLNLSYEVKEGLKKHFKQKTIPRFKSIEAEIANIADEIAYNNHDIDDGISSKLLTASDLFKHIELWKKTTQTIKKEYTNLKEHEMNHLINSHIISEQLIDVFTQTNQNIKTYHIQTPEDIQNTNQKIVTFSPQMTQLNTELRAYLHKNLYKNQAITKMNEKGKSIIEELYSFYLKNLHTIPQKYQNKCKTTIDDTSSLEEIIANYIAGMTDRYAIKQHHLHCQNI